MKNSNVAIAVDHTKQMIKTVKPGGTFILPLSGSGLTNKDVKVIIRKSSKFVTLIDQSEAALYFTPK